MRIERSLLTQLKAHRSNEYGLAQTQPNVNGQKCRILRCQWPNVHSLRPWQLMNKENYLTITHIAADTVRAFVRTYRVSDLLAISFSCSTRIPPSIVYIFFINYFFSPPLQQILAQFRKKNPNNKKKIAFVDHSVIQITYIV